MMKEEAKLDGIGEEVAGTNSMPLKQFAYPRAHYGLVEYCALRDAEDAHNAKVSAPRKKEEKSNRPNYKKPRDRRYV